LTRVTETFAALGEPSRFRIVELLRDGARSVNDICAQLDLNQPQVSKHLRVLKQAGLVDVEAQAQQRLYELRPQPLRELHDWLEGYRRVWSVRFEALDGLLSELESGEKPEPTTTPARRARATTSLRKHKKENADARRKRH
jgi:DNA-binding transcriptional ArsR family regulator